jgi:hypothetical protein
VSLYTTRYVFESLIEHMTAHSSSLVFLKEIGLNEQCMGNLSGMQVSN